MLRLLTLPLGLWRDAGPLSQDALESSSARRRACLIGASQLEACDDLLLRVMRHLTLVERLRLVLVSKRWRSLLLAELRVPAHLNPHMLSVVAFAGGALRRLDISNRRHNNAFSFEDLLAALRGAAGSTLRELIMHGESGRGAASVPWKRVAALRAACPNLASGSRLAISGSVTFSSAYKGIGAALAAVPGRHSLRLVVSAGPAASGSAPQPRHSLMTILQNPSLAALSIVGHWSTQGEQRIRAWLEPTLESLLSSLDSPECSLERLSVSISAPPDMVLPDLTEEVIAAARAAAADAAEPGRVLESFSVSGMVQPSFIAAVLARAAVKRLSLIHAAEIMSAAALAALLRGSERTLETLELCTVEHTGRCDERILAGLSEMISTPGCRLRSVTASLAKAQQEANGEAEAASSDEDNDGEESPRVALRFAEIKAFNAAIALGASLSVLDLSRSGINEIGAVMLAATLAGRARPLDSLSVAHCSGISGGGAAALLASSRVAHLDFTGCEFDDTGAFEAIAAALASTAALSLALSSTPLEDSEGGGAVALLHALADNTTLHFFLWQRKPCAELVDGCAAAIRGVLEKNGTLTALDLAALGSCDEDAVSDPQLLGAALQNNTTLRYFAINGMRGRGHAQLVRALRGNTTLRALVFDGGDDDMRAAHAVELGLELAASAPHVGLRHLGFAYLRPDGAEIGQSAAALALASTALPRCPALRLHLLAFCEEEQALSSSVALLPRSIRRRVVIESDMADGDYFEGLRARVLAEAGVAASLFSESLSD